MTTSDSSNDTAWYDGPHQLWTAMLPLIGLFLLCNVMCVDPGSGTSDGSLPGHPRGTDLELYYGWPATYRAEWWASPDPELFDRIGWLVYPTHEMTLGARYFGWAALAVNVAFAVCGALLLMLWNRRPPGRVGITVSILLAIAMLVLYGVSERVDVYL